MIIEGEEGVVVDRTRLRGCSGKGFKHEGGCWKEPGKEGSCPAGTFFHRKKCACPPPSVRMVIMVMSEQGNRRIDIVDDGG